MNIKCINVMIFLNCGIIACIINDKLGHFETISAKLSKPCVDEFSVHIASRFFDYRPRSWTIVD